MRAWLAGPGFLGSNAPALSDVTLILILITAALFTLGRSLARRDRIQAHRWVQTTSALLNATVVLLVMVRAYLVHILPGIPASLGQGDYAVTTAHALVGATGLTFGLYVVLSANKVLPKSLRFHTYKPFMRAAYKLYMLATLLGVAVYALVYVFSI